MIQVSFFTLESICIIFATQGSEKKCCMFSKFKNVCFYFWNDHCCDQKVAKSTHWSNEIQNEHINETMWQQFVFMLLCWINQKKKKLFFFGFVYLVTNMLWLSQCKESSCTQTDLFSVVQYTKLVGIYFTL